MTVLLITLAAGAYAVADLYAARWLYGTWRARAIDNRSKWRNPVAEFNAIERPFYIAGALAAALFWPVTLPGWWLTRTVGRASVRFFDSVPIRSRHELKAEREAQERRIRDLERELSIR